MLLSVIVDFEDESINIPNALLPVVVMLLSVTVEFDAEESNTPYPEFPFAVMSFFVIVLFLLAYKSIALSFSVRILLFVILLLFAEFK